MSGQGIVRLEFSEEIDASTVTRLSFTVGKGKYPVESVKVENKIILLTVNLNGDSFPSLNGEYVEQLTPITDVSNNIVEGLEAVIVQ